MSAAYNGSLHYDLKVSDNNYTGDPDVVLIGNSVTLVRAVAHTGYKLDFVTTWL